jgi:hypothetical protein
MTIQIRHDDPERDGLIEACDAEGVAYQIVGAPEPTPAAPTPATPAPELAQFGERDGEGRGFRPTGRGLSRVEGEALLRANREAAQAAKAAEVAAEAEATAVPEWVIRTRNELAAARRMYPADQYKGAIHRRQDGSWWMYDCMGARKGLPADAGAYFTEGQRTA